MGPERHLVPALRRPAEHGKSQPDHRRREHRDSGGAGAQAAPDAKHQVGIPQSHRLAAESEASQHADRPDDPAPDQTAEKASEEGGGRAGGW